MDFTIAHAQARIATEHQPDDDYAAHLAYALRTQAKAKARREASPVPPPAVIKVERPPVCRAAIPAPGWKPSHDC